MKTFARNGTSFIWASFIRAVRKGTIDEGESEGQRRRNVTHLVWGQCYLFVFCTVAVSLTVFLEATHIH